MVKHSTFFRLIMLSSLGLSAFVIAQAQQDTLGLSFDEYMMLVQDNHPLSKSADLYQDNANAVLLGSQGAFDPKVSSTYRQKLFKDDPYYRIFTMDLNIPTKLGFEINSGYDRTSGTSLNPEAIDPESGLFYAGVSIPLGRGLLIDSRRAQLQKAKLFQQSSELERILLKNELLYEAGIAYWEWRKLYQITNTYNSILSVAQEQFNTVKDLVSEGDRPTIDTVEALIQVQQLKLLYQQASLEYANASIYLSSFLWSDAASPLLLSEGTYPNDELLADNPSLVLIQNLPQSSKQHPKVQLYELQTEQLSIDERLSKENLKPQAEVKFNFILDGDKNPLSSLSINNQILGFKIGLPLFFRQERGKLQQINIKKDQTKLKAESVRLNVETKIAQSINEWQTTYDQSILSAQTLENYRVLWEGEKTLFNLGESSLFLINARQQAFIKSVLKNTDLLYKNRKAELKLQYNANLLFQG